MIVVGVDPSITACGIAAVDRATRTILSVATVRSDTSMSDEARYRAIFSAISVAIRTKRARGVAIEEQRRVQAGAYGRGEFNANNSKVSVVVGIAIGAALAHGLPFVMVSPQRAKIAVLGKGSGNAEKARVKLAVQRILGADALGRFSSDAADAVALACGASLAELRLLASVA